MKYRRVACLAAVGFATQAFIAVPLAHAQNKSNVQRQRCAHAGESAVNSQSRKDGDAGKVVGALLLGGIIGAVVMNSINESNARKSAEERCLAASGLLSKDAAADVKPEAKGKTANRSTGTRVASGQAAARAERRAQSDEITSGGRKNGWVRNSIRSQ